MGERANPRVVFMGTPSFAAEALAALLASNHVDVVAVYSQPPRPANRGKKIQKSAVHSLAEQNNIPVFTPLNFKHADDVAAFVDHQADMAIVAAYGMLLPQVILSAPTHGCVNIHASLLPRWRGAAPIHRAIEAGDAETGVCLMQMDIGLDTGDVITRQQINIRPDHTTPTLHDDLAVLGAEMILDLCKTFPKGGWTTIPQQTDDVTYAAKITKAEARLDWSKSADVLARQVRAFAPFPGSFFEMPLTGERIKVLTADVEHDTNAALPVGTISAPLNIQCADASRLVITRAQRAGKAAMAVDDLLRGLDVPAGTVLG